MAYKLPNYQHTQKYEDAVSRHAQWIRWSRAYLCACLDPELSQPDPQCTVCKGRGRIYDVPSVLSVFQEQVKHDNLGICYPQHTPILGTPAVLLRDTPLALAGTQPSDKLTVQLASPWPKPYEPVYANYDFSPIQAVTNENAQVVATNTLRLNTGMQTTMGEQFHGKAHTVTRVYNATKAETYTVASFENEYVYLTGMGTWSSGDTLQVDYTYVGPASFIVSRISQKMRYESAFVLPDSDALLVTPYWIKVTSDDLFTTLSASQLANVVLNPTLTAGNDEIANYFDVAKIVDVRDKTGAIYTVGTDVVLYGRNEVQWLTAKPAVQYSVQFMYHPTFKAMTNEATMRTAENKRFANSVNLKQFDRTSRQVAA